MAAVRVLARHGFRSHRLSLLAIAVVMAAGAGAGLTSIELAHRTDRAYREYRRQADVAELVVNPSLVTDRIGGLVGLVFALGVAAATLPGRWVSSNATVSAALRAETPAPA